MNGKASIAWLVANDAFESGAAFLEGKFGPIFDEGGDDINWLAVCKALSGKLETPEQALPDGEESHRGDELIAEMIATADDPETAGKRSHPNWRVAEAIRHALRQPAQAANRR